MLVRDNVALMFQARPSLEAEIDDFRTKPEGGSFTLNLSLSGIGSLHERIEGNAEIVHDMHKTFYGMKESGIKDNNGYVLVFVERNEEKTDEP